MTATSPFGVSRRESHHSGDYYQRYMSRGRRMGPEFEFPDESEDEPVEISAYTNRIICASAEAMHLPAGSVGLAFTSPPYNVGKEYDRDLSLEEYLTLIARVGAKVYRSLELGGRYVINIANVGRSPYLSLVSEFYRIHEGLGFLPMGEIIWVKGKGASGSCAWGSWMSAKAPRLRDLHEYLLVFAKGQYSREEKGLSDISREEFMQSTLSVWEIPPASAKRIGHPAPFPLALAERVVKLYSYVGDLVLDPFAGSGTTCVAARRLGRQFIGYEIHPEYVALAEQRIHALRETLQD